MTTTDAQTLLSELRALHNSVRDVEHNDTDQVDALHQQWDGLLDAYHALPIAQQDDEELLSMVSSVRVEMWDLPAAASPPEAEPVEPETIADADDLAASDYPTPEEQLDRIMTRLATDAKVYLSTYSKHTVYDASFVRANAGNGYETFKILSDGSLGVLRGLKDNRPQYDTIVYPNGVPLIGIRFDGGSDVLPVWGGRQVLRTLTPAPEIPMEEEGRSDDSADRRFTLAGTLHDPDHVVSADELADMLLTSVQTLAVHTSRDYNEFTVASPADNLRIIVTITRDPATRVYDYSLSTDKEEGAAELERYESQVSPERALNMVKADPQEYMAVPEATRWAAIEEFMDRAKEEYLDHARGGERGLVAERLAEIGEALNEIEGVRPNPHIRDDIERQLSKEDTELGEIVEFSADELTWEDLDLAMREAGGEHGGDTALQERQLVNPSGGLPTQQLQPVQLGLFSEPPPSIPGDDLTPDLEAARSFGRQNRHGL